MVMDSKQMSCEEEALESDGMTCKGGGEACVYVYVCAYLGNVKCDSCLCQSGNMSWQQPLS